MGTWEHRAILEGNKGTREQGPPPPPPPPTPPPPPPPPLGSPPYYPKEIEKQCVANSPSVYIPSYTNLITSSALNECPYFWSITFKTAAPQNVTDNT